MRFFHNSFCFIVLILICTTSAFSKDLNFVLDKVQVHYKTIKTIKASFDQISRSEALNQEEKSSGEFKALIPDNIKISYSSPRNQVYVVKKDNLTFLNHEGKQVLKDKVNVAIKSKLPLTFLAGMGDIKKDFDVDEIKENKDDYEIYLTPKNDSEIETLILWVKKQEFLIYKIFVEELGSNTISYELSNIVQNKDVKEDDFKVVIPKGYDLIDNE